MLEPSLEAAYRETRFRVTGVAQPFVLRVDQHSEALRQLHDAHGVECSAFITAWNPRSEPCSDGENRSRQTALKAVLQGQGLRWIEGIGEDPESAWPGEESVLVLGLDRAAACAIGRRFEQNAIVWSSQSAVPVLVILV